MSQPESGEEGQPMFDGSPLVTFSIRESHRVALEQVRRALLQRGLRLAAELDVAMRIKQELGPGVAPCTLLLVDDPALLLEGIVFHRGAALGIPQPVVVSGNDLHTEVFIHGLGSFAARRWLASADRPLVELRQRLSAALAAIAEQEGVCFTRPHPLGSIGPIPPLFVPQRRHGVDAGGAARGEPNGEEGYGG